MVLDKPTTSTAKIPSSKDLEDISELMSVGKRHLVCNEPEKALDFFVELCEQLAQIYGQSADECAEAYLYYGKTLLELARQEMGVLWNAMKETPALNEESDEDEEESKDETEVKESKEENINDDDANKDKTEKDDEEEPLTDEKLSEIKANVEHAMREGNLYNDATTEDETEPEDETAGTEDGSSKETNNTETNDDTATNENETKENEDGTEIKENDCGDEDISHMELAWEMLELTCSICSRMITEGKDKATGMLAEAKYTLAQISMEQEQYERAVEDFSKCLKLNVDVIEDKLDRRFAEIHYNIGLAHSFDKKFDESIDSFKKAKELLDLRIKMLKEKVSKAGESSGKGKAPTEMIEWEKEIKELEDLVLLDMNAKIEDAEESKKQAAIELEAMKQKTKDVFGALSSATGSGFDNGFESGFGFDEPAKDCKTEVVDDITHKVRTVKRPSDNEDETAAKKVKTNADSNSVANDKENGHANDESKPTSVGA